MTPGEFWMGIITIAISFAVVITAAFGVVVPLLLRTVRAEIGGLRGELRAEIGGLRAEMNARFDHIDKDVNALMKHAFGLDRD